MSKENGLIRAYQLNGHGGGTSVDWNYINKWSAETQPESGLLWTHLDYTNETAVDWLQNQSGVDEIIAEVLLAEDSRPRCQPYYNGLLVILRGVNMNPGADPEDMVSIRMWIEESRIITTRRRRLLSINDLCLALDQNRGPANAGEFLVHLSDSLVSRIANVIDEVNDVVDELEEQILTIESRRLRPKISSIRRQSIMLRRYLAPQRDAMARLYSDTTPFLGRLQKEQLREITDRVIRYIEDLDAARERAAVSQEELASKLSEQVNQRMYLLSVVTAIFLPLGFLTGLLGINVGGIPGADYQWSFLFVCLGMTLIIITLLTYFRLKKWM